MDYTEICKYVFKHEIIDWELRYYKSKKRQLVQARQISIYLGNWFYPHLDNDTLVSPFNQDRCSANHSIKTIKNLMFSDKKMRAKVNRYLNQIRIIINTQIQESAENEVFQQNDFFY